MSFQVSSRVAYSCSARVWRTGRCNRDAARLRDRGKTRRRFVISNTRAIITNIPGVPNFDRLATALLRNFTRSLFKGSRAAALDKKWKNGLVGDVKNRTYSARYADAVWIYFDGSREASSLTKIVHQSSDTESTKID